MIGWLLLGVIACNVLVLIIATRNATLREKAKREASNVVELRYYRRIDMRV